MEKLTIAEIRAEQINILDTIAKFCDENNIRYFLCGGTLLGAVRHKGYIPWDDDIDLMMLREDYDRLEKEFQHKDMTFLSFTKYKDYEYPFAKVSDNHTILKETKYTSKNKQMGVNIDIFPIDSMPNDNSKRKMFISRMTFIRKCLRQKRYRFERKRLDSILRFIARIALSPISINSLCHKLTRMGSKYNDKNTDYKGITVWGYSHREVCKAELFKTSVKVEFEGKEYDAPVGYHEYLTNVYGNYMQLPPVHKQKSVHKFNVVRIN